MIIEHVPDPNNDPKITDTDKLGDVPAALLEAAETFRRECLKYKRQFFLVVNTNDNQSGNGHVFWSFASEHATPPNGDDTNPSLTPRTLTPQEYQMFYSLISQGVMGISGNRMWLCTPFFPLQPPPKDSHE